MEVQSNFDFYIKFTKRLILNLPETRDRVLAAAWVKKLINDTQSEDEVKLDYLKLLLFVLQKKKLIKPFTSHPNSVETLVSFPKGQTVFEFTKIIIDEENKVRQERLHTRKESGDYPPYDLDYSADFLQFLAVQHITDFGIHAYYAISKYPITGWSKVDKSLLPKAAQNLQDVTIVPETLQEDYVPPKPSPEEVEGTDVREAAAAEESAPAEPAPKLASTAPPKESPKKPKSPIVSPPSIPIGKSLPLTDRKPPTWGTNLLEVVTIAESKPEASKLSEDPAEVLFSSSPYENVPFIISDDFNLVDKAPSDLFDVSVGKEDLSKSTPANVKSLKPPKKIPITSKPRLKKPKPVSKTYVLPSESAPVSKGFEPDEMDLLLGEFNDTLREIDAQMQDKMESSKKEAATDYKSEEPKAKARTRRTIPRSIPISKDHAKATALNKSIHISPEAQNILSGIVDQQVPRVSIVQETPNVTLIKDQSQITQQVRPAIPAQTLRTSPIPGKNAKIAAVFDEAAFASMIVSEDEFAAAGFESQQERYPPARPMPPIGSPNALHAGMVIYQPPAYELPPLPSMEPATQGVSPQTPIRQPSPGPSPRKASPDLIAEPILSPKTDKPSSPVKVASPEPISLSLTRLYTKPAPHVFHTLSPVAEETFAEPSSVGSPKEAVVYLEAAAPPPNEAIAIEKIIEQLESQPDTDNLLDESMPEMSFAEDVSGTVPTPSGSPEQVFPTLEYDPQWLPNLPLEQHGEQKLPQMQVVEDADDILVEPLPDVFVTPPKRSRRPKRPRHSMQPDPKYEYDPPWLRQQLESAAASPEPSPQMEYEPSWLPKETSRKDLSPINLQGMEDVKDILDESLSFVDLSFDQLESDLLKASSISKTYEQHKSNTPGTSYIPMTVPRPSISPKRSTPNKDFEPSWLKSLTERQAYANRLAEYRKPPAVVQSPPPIREEDYMRPTPAEEPFKWDYKSPKLQKHELKQPLNLDTAQFSPPDKRHWVLQRDDLKKKIYGSPPRAPIFDESDDRIEDTSMPKLASPHLSPVIAIREELQRMPPLNIERKDTMVLYPYKHKHKVLNRRSVRPPLETIRSPRRSPDVFERVAEMQTPEIDQETIPEDIASPLQYNSPNLFERDISTEFEPLMDETPELVPATPSPRRVELDRALETLDQEDQQLRSKIAAAVGMERRKFQKQGRVSALETITEPLDMTPTSHRPAAGSPGRLGPRRRNVRKRLQKRRLDFDALTSPDETHVAVTDIETDVEDRVLSPGELPEPRRRLRNEFEQTERESFEQPLPGSPRTPISDKQKMKDFLKSVQGHTIEPDRETWNTRTQSKVAPGARYTTKQVKPLGEFKHRAPVAIEETPFESHGDVSEIFEEGPPEEFFELGSPQRGPILYNIGPDSPDTRAAVDLSQTIKQHKLPSNRQKYWSTRAKKGLGPGTRYSQKQVRQPGKYKRRAPPGIREDQFEEMGEAISPEYMFQDEEPPQDIFELPSPTKRPLLPLESPDSRNVRGLSQRIQQHQLPSDRQKYSTTVAKGELAPGARYSQRQVRHPSEYKGGAPPGVIEDQFEEVGQAVSPGDMFQDETPPQDIFELPSPTRRPLLRPIAPDSPDTRNVGGLARDVFWHNIPTYRFKYKDEIGFEGPKFTKKQVPSLQYIADVKSERRRVPAPIAEDKLMETDIADKDMLFHEPEPEEMYMYTPPRPPFRDDITPEDLFGEEIPQEFGSPASPINENDLKRKARQQYEELGLGASPTVLGVLPHDVLDLPPSALKATPLKTPTRNELDAETAKIRAGIKASRDEIRTPPQEPGPSWMPTSAELEMKNLELKEAGRQLREFARPPSPVHYEPRTPPPRSSRRSDLQTVEYDEHTTGRPDKLGKKKPRTIVKYDLDVLQELGVTPGQLQQLNLNDLDIDPAALQPTVPQSNVDLEAVQNIAIFLQDISMIVHDPRIIKLAAVIRHSQPGQPLAVFGEHLQEQIHDPELENVIKQVLKIADDPNLETFKKNPKHIEKLSLNPVITFVADVVRQLSIDPRFKKLIDKTIKLLEAQKDPKKKVRPLKPAHGLALLPIILSGKLLQSPTSQSSGTSFVQRIQNTINNPTVQNLIRQLNAVPTDDENMNNLRNICEQLIQDAQIKDVVHRLKLVQEHPEDNHLIMDFVRELLACAGNQLINTALQQLQSCVQDRNTSEEYDMFANSLTIIIILSLTRKKATKEKHQKLPAGKSRTGATFAAKAREFAENATIISLSEKLSIRSKDKTLQNIKNQLNSLAGKGNLKGAIQLLKAGLGNDENALTQFGEVLKKLKNDPDVMSTTQTLGELLNRQADKDDKEKMTKKQRKAAKTDYRQIVGLAPLVVLALKKAAPKEVPKKTQSVESTPTEVPGQTSRVSLYEKIKKLQQISVLTEISAHLGKPSGHRVLNTIARKMRYLIQNPPIKYGGELVKQAIQTNDSLILDNLIVYLGKLIDNPHMVEVVRDIERYIGFEFIEVDREYIALIPLLLIALSTPENIIGERKLATQTLRRMPDLVETEEEYNVPPVDHWDIQSHLSPESRIRRRTQGIYVQPPRLPTGDYGPGLQLEDFPITHEPLKPLAVDPSQLQPIPMSPVRLISAPGGNIERTIELEESPELVEGYEPTDIFVEDDEGKIHLRGSPVIQPLVDEPDDFLVSGSPPGTPPTSPYVGELIADDIMDVFKQLMGHRVHIDARRLRQAGADLVQEVPPDASTLEALLRDADQRVQWLQSASPRRFKMHVQLTEKVPVPPVGSRGFGKYRKIWAPGQNFQPTLSPASEQWEDFYPTDVMEMEEDVFDKSADMLDETIAPWDLTPGGTIYSPPPIVVTPRTRAAIPSPPKVTPIQPRVLDWPIDHGLPLVTTTPTWPKMRTPPPPSPPPKPRTPPARQTPPQQEPRPLRPAPPIARRVASPPLVWHDTTPVRYLEDEQFSFAETPSPVAAPLMDESPPINVLSVSAVTDDSFYTSDSDDSYLQY